MQVPKPTEGDKDRFRSLVPDDPRVTVKPMFGNLAAFVNGNMFLALLGPDIVIKLNEGDRSFLVAEGAGPFGPAGRPMGEYVRLPDSVAGDPYRAELWIAKSLDYVGALPPKEKAKKKP